MGLFDFIISIIILALGLKLGVWLVWLIASPLNSLIRGRSISNRSSSSASNKFKRVDALIARGKHKAAIKKLRAQVIYGNLRNPALIQSVKAHHQQLLARCLIISDELGNKPENITKVEHLFMERSELQTLHLKAMESYNGFRSRRKSAGKGIPDWGKKEFEERLEEIKKELKRNEASLKVEISKLLSSISLAKKGAKKEGITYH